ncbi:MAG: hypothetical protein M3M97_07015 [Actinomycetota bacterium]|nr:hypothetical protein [Actinomycetota bacterium]
MLRLYARVAAVLLLATGVLGFSGLWGFDPLTGFYHVGVGVLFAYAGFFQRDTAVVRQIVGGLGVLLLVVKAVTVLLMLVVNGRLEHGPVEVTCLVLGVGSILAARYLPDEPRSLERRSRARRRR